MSDGVPSAVRQFAEMVEQADLHGLAFQHHELCRRRAWLHLHRVDYAHLDRSMARGIALHDVSKTRDRSVNGLLGLAPDRIDWASRTVIEAKGGAGAKEAVSCQTAFYALMLWAHTGHPWRARNEIIPQKRHRDVKVDEAVAERLVASAADLVRLQSQIRPPEAMRKPICASCSYGFLCGYR